jgi:hypothetical protein
MKQFTLCRRYSKLTLCLQGCLTTGFPFNSHGYIGYAPNGQREALSERQLVPIAEEPDIAQKKWTADKFDRSASPKAAPNQLWNMRKPVSKSIGFGFNNGMFVTLQYVQQHWLDLAGTISTRVSATLRAENSQIAPVRTRSGIFPAGDIGLVITKCRSSDFV